MPVISASFRAGRVARWSRHAGNDETENGGKHGRRLAPAITRGAAECGSCTRRPGDSEEVFEPYITKAVVAERLDVKLRTVSRLMRRRVLRHYKLGELVRFKWSEVESDVREHFRVSFDPKSEGGA